MYKDGWRQMIKLSYLIALGGVEIQPFKLGMSSSS